jgi:hypothetical protein
VAQLVQHRLDEGARPRSDPLQLREVDVGEQDASERPRMRPLMPACSGRKPAVGVVRVLSQAGARPAAMVTAVISTTANTSASTSTAIGVASSPCMRVVANQLPDQASTVATAASAATSTLSIRTRRRRDAPSARRRLSSPACSTARASCRLITLTQPMASTPSGTTRNKPSASSDSPGASRQSSPLRYTRRNVSRRNGSFGKRDRSTPTSARAVASDLPACRRAATTREGVCAICSLGEDAATRSGSHSWG